MRLIGDVVFTTPIVRALKRTFPDAHITYLVERDAAAVVAGNPHLDDVVIVGRPRGLSRIAHDLRLARELRRRRFDLVVDMHGGPRSSWLAWATRAPQRIGYDIPGRRWMYTRMVERPRDLRPRHSVANQWDLLSAIDGWPGAAPDPERDAVEMAPDMDADGRIAERLHAAGIQAGDDVIVLHVSAGNPFRRWPEPSFAHLIASLVRASDTRKIILSSGPSDREAASRIAAAARQLLGRPHDARVLDFGDFNIAELRALVSRSRLFIGGDTGPLHVAATTRTPIVGIYGPTLPARSAPWRNPAIISEAVEVAGLACRPCDQRACVHGDFRCLTTLRPEEVINAAERALSLEARRA